MANLTKELDELAVLRVAGPSVGNGTERSSKRTALPAETNAPPLAQNAQSVLRLRFSCGFLGSRRCLLDPAGRVRRPTWCHPRDDG